MSTALLPAADLALCVAAHEYSRNALPYMYDAATRHHTSHPRRALAHILFSERPDLTTNATHGPSGRRCRVHLLEGCDAIW